MTEPGGPSQPSRPRELRAADADREATAATLRAAAVEGRIDLSELDARLERAYQARTYAELADLVADLPDGDVAARPSPAEAEVLVLRTTIGSIKQRGAWAVPRRIVAESTTGSVTLDFTRASCPYREVTVEATTRTGSIRLVVPDGWAVRLSGSDSDYGRLRNKAAAVPEPGAPTVVLAAHAGFGQVRVKQRRRRR